MAREQIMLGTVLIDGQPWEGERIEIPMSALLGHELTVKGRDRIFRMVYEVPGYGR